MNSLARTALLTGILILVGCGSSPVVPLATNATEGSLRLKCDVWADNWFAFYLGETLVAEDSVPITTERSFNAESFEFSGDFPLVLNFVVKDFKQDDSGLEYIGTRRQQIGDGGFIAQFTDVATGEVVAVTDKNWKCYVIHEAPLDPACADARRPEPGVGPCGFIKRDEPSGWKTTQFVANGWSAASEFSSREVRPKDGYDRIQWDRQAKLIWSFDLRLHNTVLIRMVIDGP